MTGLDVTDRRWITSDPSHLWHIHISGYRDSATNERAWLDLASVMIGRPVSGGGTPAPTPPTLGQVAAILRRHAGLLAQHLGTDHREHYAQQVGPLGIAALKAVKDTLDPNGIMNPGVLI